ncbi:exodeoxyribonuclease VII large subunit [Actinomycetaceae bacterium WB03_NA08]|uniref:Exodeoxyribonuclease 7 large subunit n=2 Tax=Scrofimicrobium canadense TaxID=2652290 RepID=A0A6N7VNY2_9ACTO|nr:exodeoxyribonuclease VII large subunit [Scrofimicrobium canadense]
MAGGTTVENPWPLRLLASKMQAHIARMPELWIEAQVVEYKPRPGTRTAFFVIRDIESDVSINVNAFPQTVESAGVAFDAGARVVMRVKPNFWETRGSLSLRAHEILIQGEGDLLAQIDQLRRALAAEGLFTEDRKKPLPFLPRSIGLICGRNAKAKEDVLANARLRWPSAQFVIREVAVQGVNCVAQVSAALVELDRKDDIDVIVITRGGGSVEDLLPFSDESLVRLAAAARTPLVSAIGHEEDAPLLDLVADYRASTPTDAARKIVPDAHELLGELSELSSRATSAVRSRLQRESDALNMLISRPVLAQPGAPFESQLERLETAVLRMRGAASSRVAAFNAELDSMEATLRAISPQATLERGYSILRAPDGTVVMDAGNVKKGDLLEAVMARGSLVAQVFGTNPIKPQAPSHDETPPTQEKSL